MALDRERLDVLMAERGLAESRARAQQLVMAGQVRVDGTPAAKAGHRVARDARIEVEAGPRFVSRGGDKLEAAMVHFGVDARDRICLDVGASTGGFTDCLLQRGARRVFAFDVGRGQLHWKIRQDPRVTVREGLNARQLSPGDLDAVPSLAVVDVSFISLTKVLPAVIEVLDAESELITLVKPQFEAGREQVARGGVVRDERVRQEVLEKIKVHGVGELRLDWVGAIDSPIRGPAGNVEFLAYWRKRRGAGAGAAGQEIR